MHCTFAVSYTHLDVYKRQAFPERLVYLLFGPAKIRAKLFRQEKIGVNSSEGEPVRKNPELKAACFNRQGVVVRTADGYYLAFLAAVIPKS